MGGDWVHERAPPRGTGGARIWGRGEQRGLRGAGRARGRRERAAGTPERAQQPAHAGVAARERAQHPLGERARTRGVHTAGRAAGRAGGSAARRRQHEKPAAAEAAGVGHSPRVAVAPAIAAGAAGQRGERGGRKAAPAPASGAASVRARPQALCGLRHVLLRLRQRRGAAQRARGAHHLHHPGPGGGQDPRHRRVRHRRGLLFRHQASGRRHVRRRGDGGFHCVHGPDGGPLRRGRGLHQPRARGPGQDGRPALGPRRAHRPPH
mmetsp:Transcript_36849/g.82559  ORF Transcript_36849/g.82559 Transcript_36849/m.82559 type:complete len:265 (-) Transcript_36849:578-1372(-)